MHYDFIAIPDTDVPQAVDSTFQHAVTTYASEANKTVSVWRAVFTAFHRALRPGGSVWVFDLVESSIPAVGQLMRRRYGDYLTGLKDEAYRDHVFAYVEKEDTPRPLLFQLDLLRQVGFSQVEVLHKNVCFAVFGAVKG